MERVRVADVEPVAVGGGTDSRGLSGPLGTEHVALNHYRIEPGDGLPGGLHAHADQEEVFYVLEGTATFETMDGEVTVGAGGAVRFAPGEFQSGHNAADRDLVVLGIGAPRDTEDLRIPITCPDCAHDDLRLLPGGDGQPVFRCPDCDGEFVPEPCPECGDRELDVTLAAEGTAVVCRGCGSTFAAPPLRE